MIDVHLCSAITMMMGSQMRPYWTVADPVVAAPRLACTDEFDAACNIECG